MIFWAPLFHFYQPPTQFHAVLEKICDESYRPLIKLFRSQPHAEATVNINGILTELLYQHNFRDVIEGFGELAEKEQIEFTESGKYHPILPLLPRTEVARQIELNYQTNRHFFGRAYHPAGFFPPEMAYAKGMLKPIVDARLEWLIISGVACPVEWPTDEIHEIEVDGKRIAVFFRDDFLSNMISFHTLASGEEFLRHLEQLGKGKGDIYVITAMDGETFGHHIKNWEKLFLQQVYETLDSQRSSHRSIASQQPAAGPSPQSSLQSIQQHTILAHQHGNLFQLPKVVGSQEIQVVTISELLDIFPRGRVIEPKSSSWSTTEADIQANNPYPLWLDKDNPLHHLLWEHNSICLELLNRAQSLADNDEARRFAAISRGLMDIALHSDQYWWASKRPMWDVNLVNKGLLQQEEVVLNAYKAIELSGAGEGKKKDSFYRVLGARNLQSKIRDRLLFDWAR